MMKYAKVAGWGLPAACMSKSYPFPSRLAQATSITIAESPLPQAASYFTSSWCLSFLTRRHSVRLSFLPLCLVEYSRLDRFPLLL